LNDGIKKNKIKNLEITKRKKNKELNARAWAKYFFFWANDLFFKEKESNK